MMENRGRGRGFSVAWSCRVERLAWDIIESEHRDNIEAYGGI